MTGSVLLAERAISAAARLFATSGFLLSSTYGPRLGRSGAGSDAAAPPSGVVARSGGGFVTRGFSLSGTSGCTVTLGGFDGALRPLNPDATASSGATGACGETRSGPLATAEGPAPSAGTGIINSPAWLPAARR